MFERKLVRSGCATHPGRRGWAGRPPLGRPRPVFGWRFPQSVGTPNRHCFAINRDRNHYQDTGEEEPLEVSDSYSCTIGRVWSEISGASQASERSQGFSRFSLSFCIHYRETILRYILSKFLVLLQSLASFTLWRNVLRNDGKKLNITASGDGMASGATPGNLRCHAVGSPILVPIFYSL